MHLSEIQKQDADYYRVLEGEGKMNSNGLNEHWTASEARKKREIAIRKDERMKVLDEIDCILTGYESYKHISGNIIFPVDPTVTISILKKDLEKIRNRKSINMVDFVKWVGLEVLYFAYCEELAELRQAGEP